MMSKYVNRTGSWWNITPKQQITFTPPMLLGEKRNRALVGCSFTIRVRTQDETFQYPAASQIAYLADESGGPVVQENNYEILTEQTA